MKIIAVVSAKGGVGKSTFCTEIGKMFARHDKRILLVDMDIGVRSLDILLGVSEKTVYNWGDVAKDNCDFRKAVTEVQKNLWLLAAPLDFSEEYTPEKLAECLKKYANDFDYIILDSPAGLESGFKLSADVSDECIVISTPDNVSIRAASYACAAARKSCVGNVRLVINKFNKKIHKAINVDEIIDTVGARLLGIIPESSEIYNSLNGSKIPYDCKGSTAFLRISRRMNGENIPFRAKNM